MSSSNLALLTHSTRAIAAKPRANRDQISQVIFDDDARTQFLTGFHKRKLAKAEAARAKAKQREKDERLELRREKRRMLREKALENAAQVERACGAAPDDQPDSGDEEWTGINPDSQSRLRDEEYEDEETLATVTVVEDFDPSSLTHDPTPASPPSPSRHSHISSPVPPPSRSAPKKTTKPKQKKIAYQTKDERKRERLKQRARRTEKAELAGGKASRKHNSSSSSRGPKRKQTSRR